MKEKYKAMDDGFVLPRSVFESSAFLDDPRMKQMTDEERQRYVEWVLGRIDDGDYAAVCDVPWVLLYDPQEGKRRIQ